MESHQAGYMMNPAYVYDEVGYASNRPEASASSSQYSYPASHNSNIYYTIQDERQPQLKFKSSNQRKRTIALICVLILVLVIIAVGVSLGVILSEDKDDETPSVQKVQSSFQGEGILLDKTWSPDYLDSTSQLYKTAEQEFKDKVYNQLSQSSLGQYYQDVTVIGFREGSVIIEFILRFLVPIVQNTLVNANSVINEMIVIPDVTSVSITAITTTTSTTVSPSISTSSTATTTTSTSTTTMSTTKAPTTTATTKAPTTTVTTKAPTTTVTTKAPTTTVTTKSPTTTDTTKAPTTTVITKAPTTQSTSKAPTSTITTKTPSTQSTTKASTSSTTSSTTTTTTTTTTPTTTSITQPTTTTPNVIPVCSDGFSLYTILIEYLSTYTPVYLNIQSQPSVNLKVFLENWGATLINGFGATASIPEFKISDFGPPLTNSSYTLVTIRVCIASSADVNQITSLLGAYIGLLPEYKNVGLSDVYDVRFVYNYTYDNAMSDVSSSSFSVAANALQIKANGIVNTYNLTTVSAFYVKQLGPVESSSNTNVIMRMSTAYQSVTLTSLNSTMVSAADDDEEITFISIEQS